MNKNLIFKISTISNLIVSVCAFLFLIISFILATCGIIILSKIHFIIFIILISLNLGYFGYLLTILIIDKKAKKR